MNSVQFIGIAQTVQSMQARRSSFYCMNCN